MTIEQLAKVLDFVCENKIDAKKDGNLEVAEFYGLLQELVEKELGTQIPL